MNFVIFDNEKICPSKIVCIGRNYVAHIEELQNEIPDEPVIFIKPNSAICNDVYFNEKDSIDYEGEISFLITDGKITGVGFGLDLTKRDQQAKQKAQGLPWERAKAFDKSAVFSEFVAFKGDLNNLHLELYLNNKLVQAAGSQLMLTKPNDFLREVKTFITLEDGDLLMSGTPKGVGQINRGDVLLGKIFDEDNILLQKEWVVK